MTQYLINTTNTDHAVTISRSNQIVQIIVPADDRLALRDTDTVIDGLVPTVVYIENPVVTTGLYSYATLGDAILSLPTDANLHWMVRTDDGYILQVIANGNIPTLNGRTLGIYAMPNMGNNLNVNLIEVYAESIIATELGANRAEAAANRIDLGVLDAALLAISDDRQVVEQVAAEYEADIASGRIVTPEATQVLTNKVLALPTRIEFVERNATDVFDTWDDGWVIEVNGLSYRRLGGANIISDLLGWVPHGDLSILHFASEAVLAIDAQPAIRAAVVYARTLVEDIAVTPVRPGFAANVSVDLGSRAWWVKNTVSLDQCAAVELINGSLKADPLSWPAPVADVTAPNGLRYAPVLLVGGADNANSRYCGASDLMIECSNVADDVLAQNLQNGHIRNIYIHKQVNYGFRKIGPRGGGCLMENITASEYYATETNHGLRSGRKSIGVSDEIPDDKYVNCAGNYCLTNIIISGTGAHHWRKAHPFNGPMTDLATYTLTGAVSDGASGIRCTVASTAGLGNGTIVVMPWIDGISAVNNIGGRSGSYPVSNVTSTTFDVAGYAFAGAFSGTDTPKVTIWSEEMVNMLIKSNVTLADIEVEADQGVVRVVQDANGSPKVRLRINTSGLTTTTARAALDFISDGVASATFSGVRAEIDTDQNGYRFTAINGGTIAAVPKCWIDEFRQGRSTRTTGPRAIPKGDATKPGLFFTGINDEGAVSSGPNTGVFGNTDSTISYTVGGVEKLQLAAAGIIPKNGYAIANTMTRAEFVAANAELASLPDGTVIHIGPLGFIKSGVVKDCIRTRMGCHVTRAA